MFAARLFHGKSLFEKKEHRRWTWESPNGTTHAEIDHIMTNRGWRLYDASVVQSFCGESGQRLLRAKIRFDHHLEKNTCHRPKGRKQAVFDEDLLNDALSLYDWRVAEDPTVDYELLLKGLRTCANAASLSLSSRNARISLNTKALLEKRRSLGMDRNEKTKNKKNKKKKTHLELLVANTGTRKAKTEEMSTGHQRVQYSAIGIET
ncbi:unnamed protein product [Nippostrongylus brasiliensis]|uniref:WWE domain-containing protein n=1 Tax=Nippostrongylus brasiliensis TaxID=27835 RepID=A0A0N4YTJ7_NIPBR|nr:unnamed protein product [Nippostrongylus brasiliensis]